MKGKPDCCWDCGQYDHENGYFCEEIGDHIDSGVDINEEVYHLCPL
jgi:hypothetical protein